MLPSDAFMVGVGWRFCIGEAHSLMVRRTLGLAHTLSARYTPLE